MSRLSFAEVDEKKNEVRIKSWASGEELKRPEHWKKGKKSISGITRDNGSQF